MLAFDFRIGNVIVSRIKMSLTKCQLWYCNFGGKCGVLFFKPVPFFCMENAEFWRILAILSRIYALFGALITGLNSAVVPKN